jgi:hypothetical protein
MMEMARAAMAKALAGQWERGSAMRLGIMNNPMKYK